MDPVTGLVGLATGVASIISIIGKTVTVLHNLRTQYTEADLNIILLIGQLETVGTALAQVRAWITESLSFDTQHQQLLQGLEGALNNCGILVEHIDNQISKLDWNGAGGLKGDSKLMVIFEDNSTKDYLTKLDHQISAINLCLNAFRCRTPQDQKRLLDREENQSIFAQATEDAFSIIGVIERNSNVSSKRASTGSFRSHFSKTFDFDDVLMRHRVYQNSFRSMLRRVATPATQPTPQRTMQLSPISLNMKSSTADSARIDSLIRQDARKRSQHLKILALGAGHSSVVKQIRNKCGLPYDDEERERCRQSITALVIHALVAIIDYIESNGAGLVSEQSRNRVDEVRRFATSAGPLWEVTKTAAESILATWENWFVQQSFQTMNQDCPTAYFLKATARIIREDYQPTVLDIIKAPERLEYVRETSLEINHLTADIVEIPASSSTKIFSHFDGIDACLFVIDLASYDQYLDGEGGRNSLKSAVAYLETICTSRWFSASAILICFVNTEVFSKKLHTSPLNAHFRSYPGGRDVVSATQHILKRCKQANPVGLSLFWHFAEDDSQDPSTVRFVKESISSIPTINHLKDNMGIRNASGKTWAYDVRRGAVSPSNTV